MTRNPGIANWLPATESPRTPPWECPTSPPSLRGTWWWWPGWGCWPGSPGWLLTPSWPSPLCCRTPTSHWGRNTCPAGPDLWQCRSDWRTETPLYYIPVTLRDCCLIMAALSFSLSLSSCLASDLALSLSHSLLYRSKTLLLKVKIQKRMNPWRLSVTTKQRMMTW